MRTTQTLTTYLEMLAPPVRPETVPPAPQDAVVEKLSFPTRDEYLYFYRSVGDDLGWVDRRLMPPETLQHILQDPGTEVYVLRVEGEPAGFAELDRRHTGQIELVYFGLFPQFIGRGLGRYLLDWIIDRAWSYHPIRLWVHTCDLDHPAALPNYQRAGFTVYDQQWITQTVVD
jgi:GNAT superfamily N-acetyltransferase